MQDDDALDRLEHELRLRERLRATFMPIGRVLQAMMPPGSHVAILMAVPGTRGWGFCVVTPTETFEPQVEAAKRWIEQLEAETLRLGGNTG